MKKIIRDNSTMKTSDYLEKIKIMYQEKGPDETWNEIQENIPQFEDDNTEFLNFLYKTYLFGYENDDFGPYFKVLDRILPFIEDKTILDLGAGTGQLWRSRPDLNVKKVIAVDGATILEDKYKTYNVPWLEYKYINLSSEDYNLPENIDVLYTCGLYYYFNDVNRKKFRDKIDKLKPSTIIAGYPRATYFAVPLNFPRFFKLNKYSKTDWLYIPTDSRHGNYAFKVWKLDGASL